MKIRLITSDSDLIIKDVNAGSLVMILSKKERLVQKDLVERLIDMADDKHIDKLKYIYQALEMMDEKRTLN